MHQIRDWLWIGGYRDTRYRDGLDANQIGAMLQLADAMPHEGIPHLFLPVVDGEWVRNDYFERGIAFVRAQKALGKRVLVACGAGISRSVTFSMGVLMAEEGLTMFEAYRAIYAHHPHAYPHFNLGISLARYHGQTIQRQEFIEALYDIQLNQLTANEKDSSA